MSAETSNPSQREFARVETRIAVRFRRAEPEEITAFRERVVGADVGEDDLPLALVAYLRNIEYKLDLVLSRLDARFEAPLDPGELRVAVLSAGGILVTADPAGTQVGDQVRVEMLLPGDAPRTIQAMGQVTRVSGEGANAGVAIEYRSIDEGDRDAIVRLVNRLQLASGRRPRDAR
jgi:hypothetical protein